MKAFITKYALTNGIQELEVDEVEDNPSMVATKDFRYTQCYHGEGREWHRDRESAVRRAGEMRDRKVAALKKQIKKLEALEF